MKEKRENWHGRKCPVPSPRTVEVNGKLYRATRVSMATYYSWSGVRFPEYGKWWVCRFIVEKLK